MKYISALFKRLVDILVSVFLLILLLPVILVAGILLFFVNGSPVFFIQARPGLHGKVFKIFKFTTMSNEVDESGELLPDEMRISRLGALIRKTSIDELPQLINVLKGDMSLVGPRPLLVEYLPLYSKRQKKRHDVRPGITGWAQVNGRNNLSWQKRLEMDVWYVENQSLFLDMKIIVKTVLRVLKASDVAQDGQVSMTKFTGNS